MTNTKYLQIIVTISSTVQAYKRAALKVKSGAGRQKTRVRYIISEVQVSTVVVITTIFFYTIITV